MLSLPGWNETACGRKPRESETIDQLAPRSVVRNKAAVVPFDAAMIMTDGLLDETAPQSTGERAGPIGVQIEYAKAGPTANAAKRRRATALLMRPV
jgi:hypothetical protein